MSIVWNAEAKSSSTGIPVALGLWAAAIAVAPGISTKLLIAAPIVLGALALWLIAQPERWILALFFGLILLPPVAAPFGDSGVHVAPAIALIGFIAGMVRAREWRQYKGPLPWLFLSFTAVLIGSAGFALVYSGPVIAAGSLARIVLFSIGVYLFLYTLAGPRNAGSNSFTSLRLLFAFAVLGAAFACVDFYYQLPAPAGFGPQFVWLTEGVFRRAQGLFYEASTLGNFCSFFLVMILVALFRPAEERPFPPMVLTGSGVILAAALILSYSRASLVNLFVASLAFLFVRRAPLRRIVLPAAAVLVVTGVATSLALPAFSSLYWSRLIRSFEYFQSSPDQVLSGRLTIWSAVTDFLYAHPWQSIFGIGYKTLPYSAYAGNGIVADNTYLSLLAETGLVGLAVFLLLNVAILHTAWKARASFYGSWIFCFWVGEMVQMLSGDLITYWRVLPIYFWVLAMAAREAAA